MEALLSIKDVVRLLAVSDSTVRRLYRNGTLPAVRVLRQLRFDPSVVRQFMEGKFMDGK